MDKTQLIINLTEGLKDPEKAKEVVKQVQDAIDELVIANQEALKVAEDANKVARDYEGHVSNLTRANSDLLLTIKHINTALAAKKDLWQTDKEMNELMNTIAAFILSKGALQFTPNQTPEV